MQVLKHFWELASLEEVRGCRLTSRQPLLAPLGRAVNWILCEVRRLSIEATLNSSQKLYALLQGTRQLAADALTAELSKSQHEYQGTKADKLAPSVVRSCA